MGIAVGFGVEAAANTVSRPFGLPSLPTEDAREVSFLP